MKGVSGSAMAESYRANRVLVWVSLVVMVNQMGFGAITPAIALYAQSFGVSQSAIGLAISVYGLARFLANVPTGQLADRMGRRWTLVAGEIVTVVGSLLCGLATTFDQFLLFRFVSGVGGAMVVTSCQVIVADISTRANRGRMMAFYQGAFLFAVGFGPLPGGLLAQWFGLSVPFIVFAGLGVLAGVLAFSRVPETLGMRSGRGDRVAPEAAEPRISYLAQCRMMLSKTGFVLVCLVAFAQFFGRTAAIFGMLPLLATVKLGASPGEIGVVMGIISFSNLGMVYISGTAVDRFGRKPVIVPSTLLAGLALVCFAISPSYAWLLASAVLWGVAAGISGPSPAAYATDMAPRGMNGTTLSLYRTVGDLGYMVGPILLGAIADHSTVEVSLYFTAVLFVVSGGLFGLFAPETAGRKRLNREPPPGVASTSS